MKTRNKTNRSRPVFPVLLSLPLKLIPSSIHSKALVTVLNKVFHDELKEGELDFLQDKVICIAVNDAGIEFQFTLNDEKLMPGNTNQKPDLLLNGNLHDYLLLASRHEDTDTLFFNRRLHMQGDTELGLYVKNFLDGMDMDSHKAPAYLESVLQKSLSVYERLFR